MKYNKKLAVYALLPALGLLGTAGVASAHGFGMGGLGGGTPEEFAVRQQTLFAEGASLLGVSVDEIKVAWAKGQNLQDLAIAKGITKDQLMQKMKDRRIAEHKANLQASREASLHRGKQIAASPSCKPWQTKSRVP